MPGLFIPKTVIFLKKFLIWVLNLRFESEDVYRMNELAEKNNHGLLSETERQEMDKYMRVGNFLNLLHAKARPIAPNLNQLNMDSALRESIRQRANHCCECYRMPQEYDILPFQIDHIISLKHRGSSEPENLALSCFNCNAYKSLNIAGIDTDTKEVTRLFHPRCDQWNDHFLWDESYLVGRTAIGRTTIDVLSINLPERVELRRTLMATAQANLFIPLDTID